MNVRWQYGLPIGAAWKLINQTLIYWFTPEKGVGVIVVLERPNVNCLVWPSSPTKRLQNRTTKGIPL